MFVVLFFLVGGMMLTWIGVVIYAVVNANAEAKRKREFEEDIKRVREEAPLDPCKWWERKYPDWFLEKYPLFDLRRW